MAEAIIPRAEARAQGLKRYFTGKPCSKGHVSERRVADCGCVKCGHVYANAWKAENRERSRQITRDWKAANPEAGTQWHRQNREKSQAAWRRYYGNNRAALIERGVICEATRRARKKGAGGIHTAADRKAILEKQSHRCAYCRADLRKVGRHLDHIQPLALGGSNWPENLQYLCPPCNLSKGAKDPLVFAQERGFLL